MLCAQSTIISACCSVYLLATSWFYRHPLCSCLLTRRAGKLSMEARLILQYFSSSVLRHFDLCSFAYFCWGWIPYCCRWRKRACVVERGLAEVNQEWHAWLLREAYWHYRVLT